MDVYTGRSVCNCTHLTNFVSQQVSTFSSYVETFVSVTSSVEDLTIRDIAKHLGIFLTLVGVWVVSLVVFTWDQRHRATIDIQQAFEAFDSPNVTEKLAVIGHTGE